MLLLVCGEAREKEEPISFVEENRRFGYECDLAVSIDLKSEYDYPSVRNHTSPVSASCVHDCYQEPTLKWFYSSQNLSNWSILYSHH